MTHMPITPLEIRRQILHILVGVVLVILLHTGIFTSWHIFGILAVGILLSWLSVFYRLPLIGWCLDTFERKHVRPGKGAITYFIGVLLVLQLFTRDVALAAILILAIGDGVSSLIGPFGSIKTKLSDKKLFEGTFAGGLLGGLAASFFVNPFEAFLAAFIAMLFEAVEIRLNQQILNDNVIVPLVAGTVIVLLRSAGIT